jgi:hypothetical protein
MTLPGKLQAAAGKPRAGVPLHVFAVLPADREARVLHWHLPGGRKALLTHELESSL